MPRGRPSVPPHSCWIRWSAESKKFPLFQTVKVKQGKLHKFWTFNRWKALTYRGFKRIWQINSEFVYEFIIKQPPLKSDFFPAGLASLWELPRLAEITTGFDLWVRPPKQKAPLTGKSQSGELMLYWRCCPSKAASLKVAANLAEISRSFLLVFLLSFSQQHGIWRLPDNGLYGERTL